MPGKFDNINLETLPDTVTKEESNPFMDIDLASLPDTSVSKQSPLEDLTFLEGLGRKLQDPVFGVPEGSSDLRKATVPTLDFVLQAFDSINKIPLAFLPNTKDKPNETVAQALARSREFTDSGPGRFIADTINRHSSSEPFTISQRGVGLSGALVERTIPGMTDKDREDGINLAAETVIDAVVSLGLGSVKKLFSLLKKLPNAHKRGLEEALVAKDVDAIAKAVDEIPIEIKNKAKELVELDEANAKFEGVNLEDIPNEKVDTKVDTKISQGQVLDKETISIESKKPDLAQSRESKIEKSLDKNESISEATKPKSKVETERAKLLDELKKEIETKEHQRSKFDSEDVITQKRKVENALVSAAKKRRITGNLTFIEKKNLRKRAASLFEGKKVKSKDGQMLEVVSQSFGRVRVKNNKGEILTLDRTAIIDDIPQMHPKDRYIDINGKKFDLSKLDDTIAKSKKFTEKAPVSVNIKEKAEPKLENMPKESVPSKQKNRSFPETLKKNNLTGGDDLRYTPYTDKEAVSKARTRIADDEGKALKNTLSETSPLTKDKVTTGLILMQNLDSKIKTTVDKVAKSSLVEKQVEIATSLSRRLTEAGQAIQGASIVNKLSPEGLLIHAQKRVDTINKKLPKRRQIKLDAEKVEKLSSVSENIKKTEKFQSSISEIEEIGKRVRLGSVTKKDIKALARFSKELQTKFGLTIKSTKQKKARLTDYMDNKESAALARIKKRAQNLSAGIDPQNFSDVTIIGASKLNKSGRKFLRWSETMIEEFGDDIKPHLKKLFKDSHSLLRTERLKVRDAGRLQSQVNKLRSNLEANTEVTQVDLDTFEELLKDVGVYTKDIKEEALFELSNFYNALAKPTIGRRLATIQTISQLLNPKTQVRNIVGNELFYRLERLNAYKAAPIDWAVSKFTGTRSITFKTGGQSGFWEGWIKGARYGWKGIDPEGFSTQFDLGGLTFKSRKNPFHWLEKALGASLKSFDAAAVQRGYNKFLGEQAELAIINKNLNFTDKTKKQKFINKFIKDADLELTQMARNEGKYLTFQDENAFVETFRTAKRLLNFNQDFGFGDFIIKYTKSSANLLYRALEYSPLGFARSAAILKKPFDSSVFKQRAFAQSLSRAITGSFGFTGLGALLYEKGILSGSQEKDRDTESFLKQQTGLGNYQVNVSAIRRFVESGFKESSLSIKQNDTLLTYDWAQPIALSIGLGVNGAKALSENRADVAGAAGVAYESLNGALNTFTEQSLLKGLQDFLGSTHDGSILNKLSRIAAGVPSSFVPTFFSQIRQYTDNDSKIIYDPNVLQKSLNRAIYKLPFVSKRLPKAFDTFGGDVKEVYKDGTNTLFNVFINPSFVSKYNMEPEMQMIIDPFLAENRKKGFPKLAPYSLRTSNNSLAKYGLSSDKELFTLRLEGKDISEFQKRMSMNITNRMSKLSVARLSKKTPEEQEKILATEVNVSYQETKNWFFSERAETYEGITRTGKPIQKKRKRNKKLGHIK